VADGEAFTPLKASNSPIAPDYYKGPRGVLGQPRSPAMGASSRVSAVVERRQIVFCPQCETYWDAALERAKCTHGDHDHQRFEKHRHLDSVVLPDGVTVTAASFDSANPYERERPPGLRPLSRLTLAATMGSTTTSTGQISGFLTILDPYLRRSESSGIVLVPVSASRLAVSEVMGGPEPPWRASRC
jgi:hypothetical protein